MSNFFLPPIVLDHYTVLPGDNDPLSPSNISLKDYCLYSKIQ
jgi:hypothetical protein